MNLIEDMKAKEAARVSISKPRALAGAADKVSFLDQRIAEKRGASSASLAYGQSNVKNTPGVDAKQLATASAGALAKNSETTYQSNSVINNGTKKRIETFGLQSEELEVHDAVARMTSGTIPSGDHNREFPKDFYFTKQCEHADDHTSFSTGSSAGSNQLFQLERNIVNKQENGTGEPEMFVGSDQFKQLELEIASNDEASSAYITAGDTELTQLEQSIITKQIERNEPANGATACGGQSKQRDREMKEYSTVLAAPDHRSARLGVLDETVEFDSASFQSRRAHLEGKNCSKLRQNKCLEESIHQDNRGTLVNGFAHGAGLAVSVKMTKTISSGQLQANNAGIVLRSDPRFVKASSALKDQEPEKAPSKLGLGGRIDNPDAEYGIIEPDQCELAVALPVEDDEEDPYIQSAIEYDPDAKPPIQRRRNFRLYGLLALCTLVSAAVSAAVGVVVSGESNGADSDDEDLVRMSIERLVGTRSLEDVKSPYYKAFEWIKYNDTMQLEPFDSSFVQRYVLAYFYYETTVSDPWRSCNPPEPEEPDTCEYNQLVGIAPERFTPVPWIRWLSSEHECSWAGVDCSEEGAVRQINLNGQDLNGPFPEGLRHLTFLQSISLALGRLTGHLPPNFLELPSLTNIEIQWNDLSGPIPDEWWRSAHLTRLNLGANSLTGTISKGISEARNLRALYLQRNNLVGTIPSEFGEISNLKFFYANRNGLVGSIPTEITRLKNLDQLYLQKNDLSGTVPENIGDLKSLKELKLQSQFNTRLGGDLPLSIYNCNELVILDIRGNNFTGFLNVQSGGWQKMKNLRLSRNRMTGSVPTAIASLPFLADFQIDGPDMDIVGKIPPQLCVRRNSTDIFLSANCKESSDGSVEVDCDCCSTCCDHEGFGCIEF